MTNLGESLPKEILRTNRSGAYHCATIVDCNTRKYHGLLVIPVPELDHRVEEPGARGGVARAEGLDHHTPDAFDRQHRMEDRKSTRLNSSHSRASRMPSSA